MVLSPESSQNSKSERLFWPRTSEVVQELAEVLKTSPESPLTNVEKDEVLRFEKELFHGHFDDLESVPPSSEINSTLDNTTQFVPEYIATEQGRNEIMDALGIELPETTNLDEVELSLRTIPQGILKNPDNLKRLRALQGYSLNHLESHYAAMALGEEPIRDISTVTIIKDPQLFLERLSVLQQNRQFIRQVRELIGDDGDNLAAAKRMVTDIYRDKINSMVAAAYLILLDLYRQYVASGRDLRNIPEADTVRSLINVAAAAESSSDVRGQFIRMLDYVRNGAALDKDGCMTPIDEQVFKDVEELNSRPSASAHETIFSDEEIAQLSEYVFDSTGMEAFLNAYMQRIGLTKEGWTTEIREDSKSFAVNAIKKVIQVPASYKSVVAKDFPTTGVIGLVEHEIGGKNAGHAMQSVSASKNTALFELASSSKFRGKRYLAMREAGGTSAEADAMRRYFGQTRRFGTSYASALKVLLSGGAHAEAVKAFAEAQLDGRDVSAAEQHKAYALAANRVMRLLREGGRNSQPVQYVEAATVRKVTETFPESVVDMMFCEAVYDPVDMIRLHKFGLLSADSVQRFAPPEDPERVIEELLRARLASTS